MLFVLGVALVVTGLAIIGISQLPEEEEGTDEAT